MTKKKAVARGKAQRKARASKPARAPASKAVASAPSTAPRDPPSPGQAACSSCGVGLWWVGEGKRPTKCDDCADNPRRVQPGRELVPLMELRSARAEANARRTAAATSATAAMSEFSVLRMAIGLGMVEASGGDELAAARAGGVLIRDGDNDRLPTIEEARELAARARADEYLALREGRESAPAQMLQRFLARAAISMLEHEAGLSPGARPQAVYMAHKTISDMGGGKLAWPQVQLVFDVVEVKG